MVPEDILVSLTVVVVVVVGVVVGGVYIVYSFPGGALSLAMF